jgi:hypothetical protein
MLPGKSFALLVDAGECKGANGGLERAQQARVIAAVQTRFRGCMIPDSIVTSAGMCKRAEETLLAAVSRADCVNNENGIAIYCVAESSVTKMKCWVQEEQERRRQQQQHEGEEGQARHWRQEQAGRYR